MPGYLLHLPGDYVFSMQVFSKLSHSNLKEQLKTVFSDTVPRGLVTLCSSVREVFLEIVLSK